MAPKTIAADKAIFVFLHIVASLSVGPSNRNDCGTAGYSPKRKLVERASSAGILNQ